MKENNKGDVDKLQGIANEIADSIINSIDKEELSMNVCLTMIALASFKAIYYMSRETRVDCDELIKVYERKIDKCKRYYIRK